MWRYICVALAILTSTKVFGAEIGLREINVGMSQEEVISKLSSHKDVKCYPDKQYCREHTRVKRAAIVEYSFGKHVPKLLSIGLQFKGIFYPEMLDGLKEKYGEPTAVRIVQWQNRAGAVFDSKEALWQMSEGSILIQERAGKVDEGTIYMSSKLENEEKAAEKKKNAAEPGF